MINAQDIRDVLDLQGILPATDDGDEELLAALINWKRGAEAPTPVAKDPAPRSSSKKNQTPAPATPEVTPEEAF